MEPADPGKPNGKMVVLLGATPPDKNSGNLMLKTGLEDLETAQDQKMNLVCQKLQMKQGERHLDIGCGWGTLVAHAAKYYGTDSTGITIAQNGADYANDQIERWGVKNHARVHRMDYRSIPHDKFDKITCLEMAEHVGVKYFQRFMKQIAGLLKDDGLFYLQIAGLRSGYHQESLVWGGFMGEYIFPGADASCRTRAGVGGARNWAPAWRVMSG